MVSFGRGNRKMSLIKLGYLYQDNGGWGRRKPQSWQQIVNEEISFKQMLAKNYLQFVLVVKQLNDKKT